MPSDWVGGRVTQDLCPAIHRNQWQGLREAARDAGEFQANSGAGQFPHAAGAATGDYSRLMVMVPVIVFLPTWVVTVTVAGPVAATAFLNSTQSHLTQ